MNEITDLRDRKRARSPRPQMDRADRAKLFAPYAALKGYNESAHAMEHRLVPRPAPAEDRAEQLDRRLRALRRGDAVTVTWFEPLKTENGRELGQYRTTAGTYLAAHPASGVLVLDIARIETRNIVDLGTR